MNTLEEAKAILRYLKKGHLISYPDLLDEVVSAMLLADWHWKPGKAKKSTLRIVYVKNLLKNTFRPKKKSEQLYEKSQRLDKIIRNHSRELKLSDTIPDNVVEHNFDEEKLLKLIENVEISSNFKTSDRNKQIVYDIYLNGYTVQDAVKKYKICKQNIVMRVKQVFDAVRKMTTKEELLCK